MDPVECLNHAARALDADDLDAARGHLTDYRGWRGRGGFEPPRGDDRLAELEASLRSQEAAGRREDGEEVCTSCGLYFEDCPCEECSVCGEFADDCDEDEGGNMVCGDCDACDALKEDDDE